MSSTTAVIPTEPGLVGVHVGHDVFTRPWGGNVDVIRNEELEQWLAEHHIGDDIFVDKAADNKSWSFDLGPFTINISVEDLGNGKYKYTAILYFKKFGIKVKIWTFTFEIDTSKGAGSYCHEVNVVGIVKGKICILYEGKCFYLYFKLEAFGKTWEKKYKLFCI
ncbi:hypothetical protein MSAN_02397200 [Mycena sanguinolenta]|uniref:Uncharacterized protein n=1 Tax=Mycena sanguinolenta TaxID=230812 RepID=A0A8H6X4E0_9AGAR|nr:hypothetical protein MSAN_02397200 [Mycena sanguinolenta]